MALYYGQDSTMNSQTPPHRLPESPRPHAGAQALGHAAVRTLQKLGYTYEGGELWKPPLGKSPFPQPSPLRDPLLDEEPPADPLQVGVKSVLRMLDEEPTGFSAKHQARYPDRAMMDELYWSDRPMTWVQRTGRGILAVIALTAVVALLIEIGGRIQ